MFLQDARAAVKSMGSLVAECLLEVGKFVLVFAVIILGFGVAGYFFFHYFFQSLVVLVMAMLTTWFCIELKTARFIREKQEQQEAYWAEKSKPMHTEYKETL